MATARITPPPDAVCPEAPSPDVNSSVHASLLKISEALGSNLELASVLQTILDLTLQQMHAQQGSILLFDEHQDRLQMLASTGLPDEIVQKGYIQRKGSIAEWVIENNQPIVMNNEARKGEYHSLDEKRRIFSAMCVPLRSHGRVLGTINLNRLDESSGEFQPGDLELMVILTSHAAIFIENSRLHEDNLNAARLAAIGQTVAGISHCIKNMLTGVRGGMSLIEMASSSRSWERLDKGHNILNRNIERIASVILDMLDYSKERQPRKGCVSLVSLVEEVMGTVQSEAEMRQVRLEKRLDPDVKMVEVDAQQLFRCLLNLLHNAIDATPKGGTVWVGSEQKANQAILNRLSDPSAKGAVIIRVGDTGSGVSAEDGKNLFEPFFSTKGSKGTGLGLAVTRKIVEEHGGRIEVDSEPDEPAVFAIYLPA